MKATDLSCAPLDMFVTRGVDKTTGGARWRARDLQSVGCRDDGRARERFKRSAESERVRVNPSHWITQVALQPPTRAQGPRVRGPPPT